MSPPPSNSTEGYKGSGKLIGLRIGHMPLSPPIADNLITVGVDRDVRGWDIN